MLGSFVVHLFEAPTDALVGLMKHIREQRYEAVPPWSIVNIINFTEENPTRMFSHWMYKQLSISGSSTPEECTKAEIPIRSWEIYQNVCQIGPAISGFLGGSAPPNQAAAKALSQK